MLFELDYYVARHHFPPEQNVRRNFRGKIIPYNFTSIRRNEIQLVKTSVVLSLPRFAAPRHVLKGGNYLYQANPTCDVTLNDMNIHKIASRLAEGGVY